LGASSRSTLLAPRSSSLNITLDLHLPNGAAFVVLKAGKKSFLEISLKSRLPLLFDVTEPGCPFEQAIWAMEKKWPDRCRE
jgi:hypothetical protein